MIRTIKELFVRDLDKLLSEIEKFSDESDLWKVVPGVTNSAGNLCLHLVGNLNTYIGKNLGNTGYIRNRELEFSDRNKPKELLIEQISQTRNMVQQVLSGISDESEKKYPEQVLGYEMTIQYFLMHLLGHLSYHTGQINYLRRILQAS
jgi:uncharacterized damage-inducible protein DinB